MRSLIWTSLATCACVLPDASRAARSFMFTSSSLSGIARYIYRDLILLYHAIYIVSIPF
nr:MAG TPA_asm: hypothetical protein [Caudoviricetes sp.]